MKNKKKEFETELTSLIPHQKPDVPVKYESVYIFNRKLLLQAYIVTSACFSSALAFYLLFPTIVEQTFDVQDLITVGINDTRINYINGSNFTHIAKERYTIGCEDALVGDVVVPQTNDSTQVNRTLLQIIEWAIRKGAGSSQDLSHYYNISKNITDAIFKTCVGILNNNQLCDDNSTHFYDEKFFRTWPGSYNENISSAVIFSCFNRAFSETHLSPVVIVIFPLIVSAIALAVTQKMAWEKWNAKFNSLENGLFFRTEKRLVTEKNDPFSFAQLGPINQQQPM
ncbi:MAG: hypothetical protein NTZ67_08520 [Gammaproteobacteria bacterium]|nr:hypothetical protein [Gammaproteobacteria bacterium]